MRTIMVVLGVLLILVGMVWFLQGINLLPGSFMTGQTQWAVYGFLAMVSGIILLAREFRRRGTPPKN
jgi:uncharacterized membrane protein HdeD (DUF308 family)